MATDTTNRTRLGPALATALLAFAPFGSIALATPEPSPDAAPKARTMAEILADSPRGDWIALDPERLVVMRLARGRVVIELAPRFAPRHIENLRTFLDERYFDGLAVVRAQDNYVVQWGDPDAATPDAKRALGSAEIALEPEFERALAGLAMTPLPDGDVFAPRVGWVNGFPAASDGTRAWLAHCYGMVGVGRDNAVGSGSGAELYAVIGHAPRNLDRNVTLIGRVVAGIELLSSLERGPPPMGFHVDRSSNTLIVQMRIASELTVAERPLLERLDTGSDTFAALVESRRNRRDAWYLRAAGKIDLCSVPLPVRERAATATESRD